MGKNNLSFKNKKGGKNSQYKKVETNEDKKTVTVTNGNIDFDTLSQKAQQKENELRQKEDELRQLKQLQRNQQESAVQDLQAQLRAQQLLNDKQKSEYEKALQAKKDAEAQKKDAEAQLAKQDRDTKEQSDKQDQQKKASNQTIYNLQEELQKTKSELEALKAQPKDNNTNKQQNLQQPNLQQPNICSVDIQDVNKIYILIQKILENNDIYYITYDNDLKPKKVYKKQQTYGLIANYYNDDKSPKKPNEKLIKNFNEKIKKLDSEIKLEKKQFQVNNILNENILNYFLEKQNVEIKSEYISFDYVNKTVVLNNDKLKQIRDKLMYHIFISSQRPEIKRNYETITNPGSFYIMIKRFIESSFNENNDFIHKIIEEDTTLEGVEKKQNNLVENSMSHLFSSFFKSYKKIFPKGIKKKTKKPNNNNNTYTNNPEACQKALNSVSKLLNKVISRYSRKHIESDWWWKADERIKKLRDFYVGILEAIYNICIAIENNKLFLQIQSIGDRLQDIELQTRHNLSNEIMNHFKIEKKYPTLEEVVKILKNQLYTDRFYEEYHGNLMTQYKKKIFIPENIEVLNLEDKTKQETLLELVYRNTDFVKHCLDGTLNYDNQSITFSSFRDQMLKNIYMLILYYREVFLHYIFLYKLNSSNRFKEYLYNLVSTKITTFVVIRDEGNDIFEKKGHSKFNANPKKIFIKKDLLKNNQKSLCELTVYYSSEKDKFKTFEEFKNKNFIYDNKLTIGPVDGIFYNERNQVIGDSITQTLNNDFDEKHDIFIFGYGMSGAGKTSTMIYKDVEGKEVENGAIQQIIEKASQDKSLIYVKCYEFYGLASEIPKEMKVDETNSYKKSEIKKLLLLLKELFTNEKHRKIAYTPNNDVSSRSHCIAIIYFKEVNQKPEGQKIIIGDLAGSENKFEDDRPFINNEMKNFDDIEYNKKSTIRDNIETIFQITIEKPDADIGVLNFNFKACTLQKNMLKNNTTSVGDFTHTITSDILVDKCMIIRIKHNGQEIGQEFLFVEYNEDNISKVKNIFYDIITLVLCQCKDIKVSRDTAEITFALTKNMVLQKIEANSLKYYKKVTGQKQLSVYDTQDNILNLFEKIFNKDNDTSTNKDTLDNYLKELSFLIQRFFFNILDKTNIKGIGKQQVFGLYGPTMKYKDMYFSSKRFKDNTESSIEVLTTRNDPYTTAYNLSKDNYANERLLIYSFMMKFIKNCFYELQQQQKGKQTYVIKEFKFSFSNIVDKKMKIRNREGDYINNRLNDLKQTVYNNTYNKDDIPFVSEESHICSPYIEGCLKKYIDGCGTNNCYIHNYLKENDLINLDKLRYVILLVVNNQFFSDDNKEDNDNYNNIDYYERIKHEESKLRNIQDSLKIFERYKNYSELTKEIYYRDPIFQDDEIDKIKDKNLRTSIGIMKDIFTLSKGGFFIDTSFPINIKDYGEYETQKKEMIKTHLSKLVDHNNTKFLLSDADCIHIKNYIKKYINTNKTGGSRRIRPRLCKKIRKTRKKGNIIKKRFRFNKKNRKQSRLT
jgi:hypothetical protein